MEKRDCSICLLTFTVALLTYAVVTHECGIHEASKYIHVLTDYHIGKIVEMCDGDYSVHAVYNDSYIVPPSMDNIPKN